jgi:serine/threonine-protein kinase
MTGVPKAVSLAGRYVLFDELAAGGMATVHFGRLIGAAAGFSRTVAIKRLHPQFAKDADFSNMFLDEARLAARVSHPNVVSILDVASENGELFIVMEYVHGESLSKLLASATLKGTPIQPKVVATIVAGILHGLHAAHEAKSEKGSPLSIVHRDVSPQNVLVGADGVARVVDFGIAKAEDRLQITRDGRIKGKLHYMSPEQLAGKSVDRRSDIYSVGVLLWEALTQKRLFEGVQDVRIMAQLRETKPEPPSKHAALPPGVDNVVLRAIAKDPADRFSTAREMAVAIERTLGLAAQSEVGDVIADLAGDDLARRKAAVGAIEQLDTDQMLAAARPASDVPARPAAATPDDSTIPVTAITEKERRTPRAAIAIGAAALLLLALGAGTFAVWSVTRATPTVGSTAVVTVAPPAPSPSQSTPSSSPQPTVAHIPSVDVNNLPKWKPAPVVAPPKPVDDCNPPYTIDPDTKIRKIKPACAK